MGVIRVDLMLLTKPQNDIYVGNSYPLPDFLLFRELGEISFFSILMHFYILPCYVTNLFPSSNLCKLMYEELRRPR